MGQTGIEIEFDVHVPLDSLQGPTSMMGFLRTFGGGSAASRSSSRSMRLRVRPSTSRVRSAIPADDLA